MQNHSLGGHVSPSSHNLNVTDNNKYKQLKNSLYKLSSPSLQSFDAGTHLATKPTAPVSGINSVAKLNTNSRADINGSRTNKYNNNA